MAFQNQCILCIFAVLTIMPAVCQPAKDCSIVINELNTDEPNLGSQEFSEFIELKMVCPKGVQPISTSTHMATRLRDYIIIGVQEYHGQYSYPVITFSADFYRTGFKEGKPFFVIASKERQPTADMYFTDNAIGYQGKKAAGLQSKVAPSGASQASISDFFKSQSKKLPTEPNALKNGNGKGAMAIILLYQRDFLRGDDAIDSIALLRLAKMHILNRRPIFKDVLPVDDTLAIIVRKYIHDMVIYARAAENNECTFF